MGGCKSCLWSAADAKKAIEKTEETRTRLLKQMEHNRQKRTLEHGKWKMSYQRSKGSRETVQLWASIKKLDVEYASIKQKIDMMNVALDTVDAVDTQDQTAEVMDGMARTLRKKVGSNADRLKSSNQTIRNAVTLVDSAHSQLADGKAELADDLAQYESESNDAAALARAATGADSVIQSEMEEEFKLENVSSDSASDIELAEVVATKQLLLPDESVDSSTIKSLPTVAASSTKRATPSRATARLLAES